MATLLPTPEVQFIDANGNPLAGGTVDFYIPATTTRKTTWQDSGQVAANTNPVTLDAAGRAIIYGSGVYRAVVKDASGVTIYDQLTADTSTGGLAWGGVSTGSANAQTIAASSFSQQDGQTVAFIAGFTNTSQLVVSGIAVLKDTVAGPVPLTGGEVTQNNAVMMIYQASRGAFHLVEFPQAPGIGAKTNLASAATTDLGAIPTQNVNITGTTGITSFGNTASINSPIFLVTFAGILTLTHSASLLLPSYANLTTVAGAQALMQFNGSSAWTMLDYWVPGEPAFSIFSAGQFQFTSSTVCTLKPFRGNQVTFPSGVTVVIPSAGIATTVSSAYLNGVAAQALTASTLYYAYLWNQGSAAVPNWVIDWSATGHATDTASGVEIKSGDATRVLVGMAYPQAGPIFADGATARLVASWNNRRPRPLVNTWTTARGTSSASYVEVNTEIRCNFLSWGDGISAAYAGSAYGTNNAFGGPTVDGALTAFPATVQAVTSNPGNTMSCGGTIVTTEGFHYLTYVGASSSGTVTWNVANSNGYLTATIVA